MSLHSIHDGDVLFFARCAFKKIIKNFEVKVDVQNRALRFREKVDSRCVNFHPIHVFSHCCHICNNPQ
jgi:hypothetical protein